MREKFDCLVLALELAAFANYRARGRGVAVDHDHSGRIDLAVLSATRMELKEYRMCLFSCERTCSDRVKNIRWFMAGMLAAKTGAFFRDKLGIAG